MLEKPHRMDVFEDSEVWSTFFPLAAGFAFGSLTETPLRHTDHELPQTSPPGPLERS